MPSQNFFEQLEPRLLMSAAPMSVQAQHMIYLINRARHDPQAYQVEAGLPAGLLDGVDSQPPLAVNLDLSDSARVHSDEMAEFDYFAHESEVTGKFPNRLARDAGYNVPSSWPDNENYIESLAAGTFYNDAEEPLYGLILDENIDPPGHRIHLLAMDPFFENHREIGVGVAYDAASFYRYYWSIHTAYQQTGDRFLTGVVYNDLNNDGRYDPGEGLGNVDVKAGARSTTTNTAGGWSIKVPQGTYQITADGGNFVGEASTVASVGGGNREIDFISGQGFGYVDFERGPASFGEGDFNGDGQTDLVYRNTVTGDNTLMLLDGTARLGWATLPDVAPNWDLTGVADMDGDGDPDLIFRNRNNGQNTIMRMDATTRQGWTALPSVASIWTMAGVEDMDRDGDADLIFRNQNNGDNAILTLQNNQQAAFIALPNVSTAWTTGGVHDMDGNGDPDLIFRHTGNGLNTIMRLSGTTRIGWTALPNVATAWAMHGVADFDNDGDGDILFRNRNTGQTTLMIMNRTARTGWSSLPTVTNVWTPRV